MRDNTLEPDLVNPLEPDRGVSLILEACFSTGLEPGLDESNLDRVTDLVTLPRGRDTLSLSTDVAAVDLPTADARAFAKLDAVGLIGVPVTWGLKADGVYMEVVENCCFESGTEVTSFRAELERERVESIASFAADVAEMLVEVEARVFLLVLEVGLAVRALVLVLIGLGESLGRGAIVGGGDVDM